MRARLVALEAILDLLDLGMVYQKAGESHGGPGGLNWNESICRNELRI
jgi:hypothetical protein